MRSAGRLPPNCLCAQFISADSADAKNRPTSPFMSCYSQKFHSSFLLSKKKSNPVSQNWRLSEKNLGAGTNMSNCLLFISTQQTNTSKTEASTHIHTDTKRFSREANIENLSDNQPDLSQLVMTSQRRHFVLLCHNHGVSFMRKYGGPPLPLSKKNIFGRNDFADFGGTPPT